MCGVVFFFSDYLQDGLPSGNATPDHLVLEKMDGFVRRHDGNVTRNGSLCHIATDCQAVLGVDGMLFTKYATDFCDLNMSWLEFVVLDRAVLRIANHIGYEIFDPRMYFDNESNPYGSSWRQQLPHL